MYDTIIYYKVGERESTKTMTSGLIDFYLTINALIKLKYEIIKIIKI